MEAHPVVKVLDVISRQVIRLLFVDELTAWLLGHQFAFIGAEKTFGYSVVPAIGFATHAGYKAVFFQHLAKQLAGVLAPTI